MTSWLAIRKFGPFRRPQHPSAAPSTAQTTAARPKANAYLALIAYMHRIETSIKR